MFYINFIKGDTISNFFKKFTDTPYIFYKTYIYSFYYLLNSISLLEKNNIVHNDLHTGNIMYQVNKNRPIIIDFGLSFYTKKFYKSNKPNSLILNYPIIKQLLFDFREDSYNHNIEKRFISFFIYNKNNYYKKNIIDDNKINDLTKPIIQIFINDVVNSIKLNNELTIFFI